ncbi:hypothetical protein BJV74DRAFT_845256 [Russula compacta]|nr:hypothetical protein BJV74DRAFT_845256 [Russula compacta]
MQTASRSAWSFPLISIHTQALPRQMHPLPHYPWCPPSETVRWTPLTSENLQSRERRPHGKCLYASSQSRELKRTTLTWTCPKHGCVRECACAPINTSGRGDLARRRPPPLPSPPRMCHRHSNEARRRTRAHACIHTSIREISLAATSTSTAAALTSTPCVCCKHSSKARRTFFVL